MARVRLSGSRGRLGAPRGGVVSRAKVKIFCFSSTGGSSCKELGMLKTIGSGVAGQC